jgi:hypothetical protein
VLGDNFGATWEGASAPWCSSDPARCVGCVDADCEPPQIGGDLFNLLPNMSGHTVGYHLLSVAPVNYTVSLVSGSAVGIMLAVYRNLDGIKTNMIPVRQMTWCPRRGDGCS